MPMAYNQPTVSPFLMLNSPATGISNYQTLVRPLIEDQEMRLQQNTSLHKPSRRARETQKSQETTDAPRNRLNSRVGRFMHFSHFYSDGRQ
jgi:hypothetical protein